MKCDLPMMDYKGYRLGLYNLRDKPKQIKSRKLNKNQRKYSNSPTFLNANEPNLRFSCAYEEAIQVANVYGPESLETAESETRTEGTVYIV